MVMLSHAFPKISSTFTFIQLQKKYDASDALLGSGQCMYLPDGAFLTFISKGGEMLQVDYRGQRLFIPAWTNMK